MGKEIYIQKFNTVSKYRKSVEIKDSNMPIIVVSAIHTADKSSASNEDRNRWLAEEEVWCNQVSSSNAITYELINCDTKGDDTLTSKTCNVNVSSFGCIDSSRPGIFNKTILSLKKNFDDPKGYTHFVRTNTSTYILNNRLLKIMKSIDFTTPVYTGVAEFTHGLHGGWGIILTREAVKLILDNVNRDDFTNSETEDDILIPEVLTRGSDNVIRPRDDFGYSWVWEKSVMYNMDRIMFDPNIVFIRLKNRPNTQTYLNVVSFLSMFR